MICLMYQITCLKSKLVWQYQKQGLFSNQNAVKISKEGIMTSFCIHFEECGMQKNIKKTYVK